MRNARLLQISFAARPTACPARRARRGAAGVAFALALALAASASASASAAAAVVPAPVGDTPIPAIQGRGAVSPMVGRRVTTRGAVTRATSNGFFLQDIVGDGDPRTSDAVFVYTGAAPVVQAGQCVRVDARVVEFDVGAAGNADTAAHTVTELHGATAIEVLGDGCVVRPVDLALPLRAGDDMERFEGMLVTLRGPLTVQQNYFLGRFGELTLAAGGRVETPTNRLRPGAAARALAAANARRSLLLDDGDARQHPSPAPYLGEGGTVRDGDTAADITGVVDYGLAAASASGAGAWKIHPTHGVRFARANPRTAVPAPVGGTVKIVAANVENFFSTLADGVQPCAPRHLPADCRGARSVREFALQRAKIVAELAAIDADVVGLMEIENNGATALGALVEALNARAGAAVYAQVADPAEGAGTDAIKVALLYKPARVRPVGAARSDVDAIHDRPPLAQAFETVDGGPDGAASAATGRDGSRDRRVRLNVIVGHFKSRRCAGAVGSEADQGDLQGCWNHRRVLQAQALRRFAAAVQRRSGIADTLLVGDFNAYAREDPVVDLADHGFADQLGRFDADGYSFVFDGAAGRIDQVFASASLAARVTGATVWHVNADEPSLLDYAFASRAPACAGCGPDPQAPTPTPWRASDHDPVVVGVQAPR